MTNLSMAQALSLWTDLMQAEFNRHGFCGDTAEIYAYRLQPCCPSAERAMKSSSPTAGVGCRKFFSTQAAPKIRNIHK